MDLFQKNKSVSFVKEARPVFKHGYEFVATGNGFWVANPAGGSRVQVIDSSGNIKGDIQEALAQGSIYIGNALGVTSELTIKGDGQILIGNGTTATSVAVTGDVTISNAGVTAIGALKVTTAMIAADAVDGTKIADAAVSLEHLDTGIAPSHVVKFAGSSTAEDDVDASVVVTVTGALETDVASVILRASANDVYVKKAVLSADTLTVTLSGNGGAGTVVDYVVYRAAA